MKQQFMNQHFTQTQYYKTDVPKAIDSFSARFAAILHADNVQTDNLYFVCIGTDKATGDCLGPIVGSLLSEAFRMKQIEISVYGTLQKPVHALNLQQSVSNIMQADHLPYIIAIDASLGSKEHIGNVTLSTCSLYPGKGVKKEIPAIGDLSITGIVNSYGNAELSTLHNTRLYSVFQMSRFITAGILKGMYS